jgi:hypothetical protein
MSRPCYSILALAVALLATAGCELPPDRAFANRGAPESLLDISSEVVSLSVATPAEITEFTRWIGRDAPSRAELACPLDPSPRCADARRALERAGVPYQVIPSYGEPTATLVYERVIARDCNPRYVDNAHNNDNLNHSALGCSVAANMVQQITNKQEIINPALMENPGAERAVSTVRRASKPSPKVQPYQVKQSTAAGAAQQ